VGATAGQRRAVAGRRGALRQPHGAHLRRGADRGPSAGAGGDARPAPLPSPLVPPPASPRTQHLPLLAPCPPCPRRAAHLRRATLERRIRAKFTGGKLSLQICQFSNKRNIKMAFELSKSNSKVDITGKKLSNLRNVVLGIEKTTNL